MITTVGPAWGCASFLSSQAALAPNKAAESAGVEHLCSASPGIAAEFEGYVEELLRARRGAGVRADDDLTSGLLRARVRERPLQDEEIASLLRNATVGEVGTISAALAIMADFLTENAAVQEQLRGQPSALPAAIEEILRIHGPLVANRRVTTRAVDIAGRRLRFCSPSRSCMEAVFAVATSQSCIPPSWVSASSSGSWDCRVIGWRSAGAASSAMMSG